MKPECFLEKALRFAPERGEMPTNEDRVSKDFVYTTDARGKLVFVGDFEGLYSHESDPWGQMGNDDRLKAYYAYSRKKLAEAIQRLWANSVTQYKVLEIGCGFGCVSQYLNDCLSPRAAVSGMDISLTAINKARSLFPSIKFIQGNICAGNFVATEKYETVIMCQILWYVLEALPNTMKNIGRILPPSGYLVFSNAFLKEQKYGREIIDGFDGLLGYILQNHTEQYRVIYAQIDYSGEYLFDDGILILQKR